MMFYIKTIFKELALIFTLTLLFSSISNASFIKLLENDFLIKADDNACFTFISSCDTLKLLVNENFLKDIENFEGNFSKECILLSNYGNYKIELKCNEASIYFFVNSSNYTCKNYQEEVKIIDIKINNNTNQYEENELKIIVKNFGCKGKATLLKIFVNDNLVDENRIFIMPNETKEIEKKIRLLDFGKNKIKIEIDKDFHEKEIYVEKRSASIFPLFFILLILQFIILFRKYEISLAFDIFIYLFVSSIVFLGYIFDKLNIFLFSFKFSLLLFFFMVALLLISRNFIFKKSEKRKIKRNEDLKLFAIAFILIFFFTLLPKFIVKTQNTYWNVFYERQVRETFYNGLSPRFDELSYLGREMSYPTGYFILKSSLLWLFNLSYSYAFDILLEIFFNIMIILSLIYLTKNLKVNYSLISRLIFLLSFCSFVFIFTLLSAHLLHVPSLALLFYSLAIILEKNISSNKKIFLTSFLLLSSSLIHPYALILYLAFYLFFVIIREIEFNFKFIIPLLIASFPFIGKSYSSSNVALASQWGWFLKGGFTGLIKEFSFLFLIALIIIILDIFEIFRKRKINDKQKRRLITETLSILSLIIYSVVSFRVNILSCFLISFVLMDFINRGNDKKWKKIKNKYIFSLILFFIFANYFYSIYEITYGNNLGGYIDEATLLVIENLGSNGYFIKSDEKIIADPFLGHAITFISGKKVLADLYVEYANETKLKDAIEFSTRNDFLIPKKYNINKAITKNSCNNWNKIYDNLAYKICENSKN
ncbi:MAG: hypothetical protein QXJ20_00855 [Candidatus Aenigmatarchaeota archaeon]